MSDHYHFIGIGGIGMSGLAHILLEQKKTVSGSDLAFNEVIDRLIQRGATIYKGQAAENIPPEAKVIYSSDVKKDNPEYRAAKEMESTLLHRSDLLAELIKKQDSIAVAGTHGKTTTSSLLASVLVDAGLDPSFAIGGILPAYQSNARYGKGQYFAFEADESDRSFLKYFPFGAIITNINNDHLINYEGNFNLLIDSFKTFMAQVQSKNHLIWCKDDSHLVKLNFLGQSYGFDPKSDWRITNMRQEEFKIFIDIEHQKARYLEIEVALAGRHNALNATAVFALSLSLGISEELIRKSFKNFKGVLRRCEFKGMANNILFIDDYAHHPVEIQTTLEGIKHAIGSKRLVAVFQPHRYTRTQDCLGSYGTLFESVDELLLTDIFGAGETPIPNVTSDAIYKEIQSTSTLSCKYVPRSALGHYLSRCLQPFDVVVTLGAGDITKLANETLSLLDSCPECLPQDPIKEQ